VSQQARLDPGPAGDGEGARDGAGVPDEDRRYLAQVMAEIEEEVRRRRAAGELPARVERELDELFLEHSPVAGRGGNMGEALRMVDAAAFIDPVVPVGSNKSGGAVVKKSIRSLNLWYMGYVTHQVSQFATATSRALHLLDDRVTELRRRLEAQQVPPAGVVETPWTVGVDAWWVAAAVDALEAAPGRVLHAACGDGWLVQLLTGKGIDAYGVDARAGSVDRAESDGADLRHEALLEHLGAVEPAALGGVVLSGVVDGMTHGERDQLLAAVCDRLAPGGVAVVHSLDPAAWASDAAPPEADLCSGRPLRPATWSHVLATLGFEVDVVKGPSQADYVVTAVLRHPPRRR
jgi:SAM-dependent methyltransferase